MRQKDDRRKVEVGLVMKQMVQLLRRTMIFVREPIAIIGRCREGG
jgi:hypothetical protein